MKKRSASKIFIISAIMILSVSMAYSQGGRPGGGQGGRPGGGPGGGQGRQYTEEDVKNRVKRMSQEYNFSEEQEKQITEFEVTAYKKNMVERQKFQGDWQKMREYGQQQRELRDQKFKEVLTEEQYKKFKEEQDQLRQEMQNRREEYQRQNPGQGPGQRPDEQNKEQRPPRGRGGRG